MKICVSSKGSIFIVLILTMTLMSVFGAAILSITTTLLYSKLSFNNFNKADYYAESGIRYVELTDSSQWYFDEEKYFTILENSTTKKLEIFQDPLPPAFPKTIDTAGFHIGITGCNIKSTGSVNENSPFEAKHLIIKPNLRKLPCWKFDTLILVDSCGKNRGKVEGSGISLETGKIGGAWKFNGSSYVKTLFRPYCEIGNEMSFSISFWAKLHSDSSGIILGIKQGIGAAATRFSVGLDSKKWMWALGKDMQTSTCNIIDNTWYYIIVVYDYENGTVIMNIHDCTKESWSISESIAIPKQTKHLFIGAENDNGFPGSFFKGEIDELEIKKYETGIADIDALIAALSPSCP